MKHILLTTSAAVVLVGWGEAQQATTPAEAKPVEPVGEAATPELPTAKPPDISIREAVKTGNIETVKQHLDAGADVNAKGKYGSTPLHNAATKEIAELLITNGADINAKINDGSSPLHAAALEGHKEVAELLIAKGADVNARSESVLGEGKTALDWAVEQSHTKIAYLLRKHGGKTAKGR